LQDLRVRQATVLPPVLERRKESLNKSFPFDTGKLFYLSMKAVAIVGYKKSGKTTLVRALAAFLKKKGYKIAIVKHAHRHIDIPEKDTQFFENCSTLVLATEKIVSTVEKRFASLEDILSRLDADYVLVEGFKQNKTLPRIVCYNTAKEKKELSCGLEIGFVKNGDLKPKDVKSLAGAVIKRSFKLPGINCGKCGFKSCLELARQILKGEKSFKDCAYKQAKAKVWVGGKFVFLNFFVEDILRNTVKGFVQSLKGAERSGNIKIEID
jgi:molybdopterin-guanine dinucleotide biosynthesis protein B